MSLIQSFCHYVSSDDGLVSTYTSILENLGESRMDMHGVSEVGNGGVAVHVGSNLLNDVGRVGTIRCATENLAVSTCNEFHHSFWLVDSQCLAVSTVITLEGTALYALLLALIFCQSDSGSFWICVQKMPLELSA